ncbi:GspH/FimT family pseudopilin [Aquabacterium sp. CECT 9606]|uniref:GspH/FimT family pseudopilin n=1 Tax=Aquabacterium sp. CECT 9606 TaxID=2845822 RepID=UPI001E60EB93|nr:GspH/FimT family pseudopilin [Aquabacterium sp. CECT 9606]CAH0348609.1 hypothetical protein AQB9606_00649 [Aquabacterium sp. CECT 9606]
MNKRAFRHTKTRDKGFTLVELMVTVAILVILLAIGAPQLQTFLVKRSVSTQADIFASALRMARSEAIKRGQRVVVCATNDPEAATRSCAAASTNWATGWLVFVDRGTTANAFDAGDELLAVQQALPSSGGITLANSQTAIAFRANGLAVGSNNSFRVRPNLTGSETDSDAYNRCVVLAPSGRVKIENEVCP